MGRATISGGWGFERILACPPPTNMEISVAATSNGAVECGLQDELGTVEEARIADLIVLDDDPLTDIAALGSVQWVIHNGVFIRSP